jgi:aminoglycoside phosphotransferase
MNTQQQPVALPIRLAETYGQWEHKLAWSHAAGAVYKLTSPQGEVHFIKLTNESRAFPLKAEADRLRWASRFAPVPEVLAEGRVGHLEWLVTRGLEGEDATTPELRLRPARLVPALARGLRRFHESLPVADCPFDFRLDTALKRVRERFENGLIKASHLNADHGGLNVEEAVSLLERSRPNSEDLVACHGDFCFPNALLRNWEVVGFLDLGELGVADRWWDLAVATWSSVWNLGPGYEELFLESYGVRADPERIAFYRLLYDLTS